jgi:hypothetical protein
MGANFWQGGENRLQASIHQCRMQDVPVSLAVQRNRESYQGKRFTLFLQKLFYPTEARAKLQPVRAQGRIVGINLDLVRATSLNRGYALDPRRSVAIVFFCSGDMPGGMKHPRLIGIFIIAWTKTENLEGGQTRLKLRYCHLDRPYFIAREHERLRENYISDSNLFPAGILHARGQGQFQISSGRKNDLAEDPMVSKKRKSFCAELPFEDRDCRAQATAQEWMPRLRGSSNEIRCRLLDSL